MYWLRGNVSTRLINLNAAEENASDEQVTLNMGHVLQALIGCSRFSRNMGKGSGMIDFDHTAQRFSHVNTCMPGICFSSTKSLTESEQLEKHHICIIMELRACLKKT
ncbi:hypothetical protein MAR_033434 [Mya arenaria]|uniref:Uncharacterized protein n=1 Tax=Mya arenaria TaxID=6604 RepID=A0ABY7G8Z3_MYAAR|nr:hypothetical protein MAR_033434 [Mya arenaria]